MEGLEVSILKLSEIYRENNVLRLDGEYFKKKYLQEDIQREKYNNIYLGDIAFITDGQHGYHEVDNLSEIRHLTAKNFKNWFANDIDADRLAKWVDENNRRSSLQENDVILTTRGSVGYCALTKSNVLPANIDQDVARIKLNIDSPISPHFLLCYLNSKFGKDWCVRNQTGMVQQGISLWRIKELSLPIPSSKFQTIITDVVEDTYNQLMLSKKIYQQSETLLLKELGLENFKPTEEAINIKSFKNSFASTGRLDAEYYQPKYEDYENIITHRNYFRVKECFDLVTQKINHNKPQYNYIEIGDIYVADGSISFNLIDTDSLPDNAKIHPKQGDLLISKVRPYRGAIAIIDQEISNLVVSGAFTVLRKKNSSPYAIETLKLILRSSIYKDWLLKFNVGTQYPVIKDEDILNLPIPSVINKTQENISTLIQQSSLLKSQSEHLLEMAKQAVEIAIEQSEEAALAFIEQESKLLESYG